VIKEVWKKKNSGPTSWHIVIMKIPRGLGSPYVSCIGYTFEINQKPHVIN